MPDFDVLHCYQDTLAKSDRDKIEKAKVATKGAVTEVVDIKKTHLSGLDLKDIMPDLAEHEEAGLKALEVATITMYEGFMCQALMRSADKRKMRLVEFVAPRTPTLGKDWKVAIQNDVKALAEAAMT